MLFNIHRWYFNNQLRRLCCKFLTMVNSETDDPYIDLTSVTSEVASDIWPRPNSSTAQLFCKNGAEGDGWFCPIGVRVFIEKKAQLTLLGTEMDFVESKLSSEFIFNNPNIKGMCGCGESFSVWACEPTLDRKDWTLWGSRVDDTSDHLGAPGSPLLPVLQTTS